MEKEDTYEGTKFKKGNQAWRTRTVHGRAKLFESPEQLWNECVGYFEWVENNPLWEHKVFSFQGDLTETSIPRLRAMTINGLCLHLGVHMDTWRNYGKKKEYSDFFDVVSHVESIIYEQKFTGAAADMLNPNIIARDLGLADRQQVEQKSVQVVVAADMSASDAARAYQDLMGGGE